jgi:AraC family ethanolamine operon transcriptional activator
MPYQVFAEFDAYEDAIQHAQVRMTLHRRERPKWAVGQMSFGNLYLQWGTSGGGMVSEGEILPGGHALFIPLNNFTTNGVNGCRLNEDSIMVAASGSEFCISADGWNHWCSLFIPHSAIGDLPLGRDEQSSSGCRVASIGRCRLRQVRRAVRQAARLASGDVSLQSMWDDIETLIRDFAKAAIAHEPSRTHRRRGRPRIDRHGVVRLVADDPTPESNQISRVGEFADAAGVSERTLLRVFRDWFGVTPARYARLRQLHAVRNALLDADPGSTTVTAVLVQYNIDQFGRFAGVYRSLFGESPSETLSRGKR